VPLLDAAAISTEFCGGDQYSVLFQLFARGGASQLRRAGYTLGYATLLYLVVGGEVFIVFVRLVETRQQFLLSTTTVLAIIVYSI